MFRHGLLAFALLSLVSMTAAQADGAGAEWGQNFANAKAEAKTSGKDLLVDFTGSDWCVWCQRLDREVFQQPEFEAAIGKDFVLVKLDFPRDESLVTEEIRAQNERLKADYRIQGFPTIFLLDAAGRPYAQTGYQQGGATAYLEHLAELKKAKAGRDEHFSAADAAKGLDRARHLAAGLDAMDSALALAHYRPIVDEIVQLDAANEAGLNDRFTTMIARVDIENEFQELAQQGKWDEVEVLMGEALEKHKGKPVIEQMATFYRAVVALESRHDFDAALRLIDKARAFAPDSDYSQTYLARVRKNVEQMRAQKEGKRGGGKKDDGD